MSAGSQPPPNKEPPRSQLEGLKYSDFQLPMRRVGAEPEPFQHRSLLELPLPTRDAPSIHPPARPPPRSLSRTPAAAPRPALTPPRIQSLLHPEFSEVYYSLPTPNHAHSTTEEVTFQILT